MILFIICIENLYNFVLHLQPMSVNRQSFDSRSSGIGIKRKETRPVGDSSFKSQCIDKILDFMREDPVC